MQKNDIENNELKDFETKVWEAVDIIRAELPVEDYYIVCFFLVLKEQGLLKYCSTDVTYFTQMDFYLNIDEQIKNNEKYASLEYVYDAFNSAIQNLYEITLKNFIRKINALDEEVLSRHFSQIFENLFHKIAKMDRKSGGHFYQPFELTRLISALANISGPQIVYNPFGGTASLASFLPKSALFIGEEANRKIWAMGLLRLIVDKNEDFSGYFNKDSITEWNSFNQKYDLIFANPPFAMRLEENIHGQFGPIKTAEQFLIEKGIASLKEAGKLIAVISHGFLFRSGTEQTLRKYLIENDLLEMVISFPGGILLNTGVAITVLVINKNKEKKGKTLFINAKYFVSISRNGDRLIHDHELYSSIVNKNEPEFVKSVDNCNIKDFDYNLNVPLYFQEKIEGVALAEIVSVFKGVKSGIDEKGKFVRIRDLKADHFDSKLDLNSIAIVNIPRTAVKISESVLLVASRWRTLKPTYFEFTGHPIFISSDIIALSPDYNKIDLSYLIFELNSKYVDTQLEIYRTGSIIPSIRKQELMELKISLPALEQQKFKIKGFNEALVLEKKKELDLLAQIHGLENILHQENSFLRHSIAGPLKNIRSAFNSLKNILITKISPGILNMNDLKENEISELTLGKYLEILERDIAIITENTRRNGATNEIDSDRPMSPINIMSFLNNYVAEIKNNSESIFDIEFSYDEKAFLDEEGNIMEVYVFGNEVLLKDLLDNLIENAVIHAFKKNIENKIDIFLMGDEFEGKEITLLFSNTGEGFPPDYTYSMFITKGSRAGINAGDGFGGWYINEIIKMHGGELDIIDEQGPEGLPDTIFATSFEIKLPIYSH